MDILSSSLSNLLSISSENTLNITRNILPSTASIIYPLLPLLFHSLEEQRYQPQTKNAFNSAYDFIVVGAGSAGSVVASRLSENPCVSVLLLEAGGKPPRLTEVPGLSTLFIFNPMTSTIYFTKRQKNAGCGMKGRKIPITAGKGPGGSSNTQSNVYVRGNPKDFDLWEENGASGWSWKDVLPYFKKLEDNRNSEYLKNGYHSTGGPVTVMKPRYTSKFQEALKKAATELGYPIHDSNGPFQKGFYDHQGTLRNSQRCSSSKSYLVPAENRTNLDIVINVFVKKVTIANGRAVGVEFDYYGKHFEVKALKEVIVSAGAINTPKFLMLSGIGPKKLLEKHGIEVVADLPVGENLQDHTLALYGKAVETEEEPFDIKLFNPATFQSYISSRTGPLASAAGVAAEGFFSFNSSSVEDYPDFQIEFLEPTYGAIAGQTLLGIRKNLFDSAFVPLDTRPAFFCACIHLHPKSRGYIRIKSSNPYEPPVIDPKYFSNKSDLDGIVAGMKLCDQIEQSNALRRYGVRPLNALYPPCEKYRKDKERFLRCLARTVAISTWHLVGTAEMGNTDDPTTVVDPKLRVKNIQGLRVVDASVMPLVTSGNTYTPTIMIAEKASDMIKEAIKCV